MENEPLCASSSAPFGEEESKERRPGALANHVAPDSRSRFPSASLTHCHSPVNDGLVRLENTSRMVSEQS